MPEEDIKEDIKEDSKVEDRVEEKVEEKEEEVVDRRTAQALELLEALEDPNRAKVVISHLARQAGLDAFETRKEETQAIKTAKAIVKRHLGEDYAFLTDKLGDALEELIDDRVGSARKDFETREQTRAQREFERDYQDFLVTNKVTEDEAGIMTQIADELQPGKNVTVKKYLAQLLKLSRTQLAEKATQKQKQQKIEDNFKRRPESIGIEANELRMVKPPKTISVRDAVLAASRGEKWSE